jgi:hypothetical protein
MDDCHFSYIKKCENHHMVFLLPCAGFAFFYKFFKKRTNELVFHNGGMVSYLQNHNALNEEPYPINSS